MASRQGSNSEVLGVNCGLWLRSQGCSFKILCWDLSKINRMPILDSKRLKVRSPRPSMLDTKTSKNLKDMTYRPFQPDKNVPRNLNNIVPKYSDPQPNSEKNLYQRALWIRYLSNWVYLNNNCKVLKYFLKEFHWHHHFQFHHMGL